MVSIVDVIDTENVEAYNLHNTDDKKDDERLQRMSQVISKFASTLVLKPIAVELSTSNQAPAWSTSDTIYFNSSIVKVPTNANDVIHIKGLGLHEIAHIMMTPSVGTKLGKRVSDNNLWRAFNALEDQRIEMWMVNRFSNVDDWLSATIANYLLNEVENYKIMYPLIHGRKYLPIELRNQVASMFAEQDKVAQLGGLIDEYIQLNVMDYKCYDRAYEIIAEYDKLVNDLFQEIDPTVPWYAEIGWDGVPDINGHEHRSDDGWSVKPMTKKEADPIVAKVATAIASDKQAQEQLAQASKSLPPNPNKSTDTKSQAPQAGNGDALKELAEKLVKDVISRKQNDINKSLKQFSGEIELNSRRLPDPKQGYVRALVEPSGTASAAVKKFASELLRLKADHDPGWNRKVDIGRLNVQRYVTGCEIDEAFDQWDLGREDAVDIECVMLVDTSGSMYSNMYAASESMWAIKRSMDKVNASTTVVGFSHNEETLYNSRSRASTKVPVYGAGGGTEPLDAIRYARSVFANSSRAIKVLVCITDGYWSDSDNCDSIIKQLNSSGVITALGMIGASINEDGKYLINAHNCQVAVPIDDMTKLFELAKGMVKVGIARNLSK